jgi:hypothetical protein
LKCCPIFLSVATFIGLRMAFFLWPCKFWSPAGLIQFASDYQIRK